MRQQAWRTDAPRLLPFGRGDRSPDPATASDDPDAARPWPLRARLRLELDALPSAQRVEVGDRAAVEEELLPVVSRDEAKAAVGHDLLDGPLCHLVFPWFLDELTPAPVEEPTELRPRREPLTASGSHSIREPDALRACPLPA